MASREPTLLRTAWLAPLGMAVQRMRALSSPMASERAAASSVRWATESGTVMAGEVMGRLAEKPSARAMLPRWRREAV